MPIEIDDIAGADGSDPKESRRLAKFWLDQIDLIHDNSDYKRFVKRGESIEKRYRDERTRGEEDGQRHYNSLWANVEILFPALYGKVPLPVAERRFRDKDPTGRGAAQMLERALRNEIEVNGFDEALQNAVKDYLLAGRGTIWVRYEPQIEAGISLPPESETDMRDAEGSITGQGSTDVDEEDDTEGETEDSPEEEKLEETGDRIVRESTPIDYVQWQDFYIFPMRARVWAEVTAVGKRVYMSRDQMKRRFGNSVGKAIPLRRDERDQRALNTSQIPSDADKGAVIEIWSRDDAQVFWVAEGYEYLCDRKDDPLKLEYFYPCPKPIFANSTTNTLLPVADYIQYQDQAVQIDELTQRISMLSKACKVAGVYNSAADGIKRLFDESVENELIPVDDWAAFADKGGVEGNVSFIPLKEIMGVLNELVMVKDKQVLEMDRLTGITDIMKGTTDARETLGGQRLKTNSAGTRLQRRQNEVARFARDTVRIMADIMAQHFSPQSLIDVSGALYEEGLGPDDMPDLSSLQQQGQGVGAPGTSPPSAAPMAPPGGPQSPPARPPGVMPPPQGMPPPGAPPMAPPGPPVGGPTPPGMPPRPPMAPPGQNVVPFRPPGPLTTPPPGGMPGQMGMPPAPPPIPPELQAKLKALERIAKAIDLIRNEKLRGFRVDIEVDSTIYGDYADERAERTQFLTAVTTFLTQAGALTLQMPQIAPLMGKMLQFGVRGFKVGRDLEVAVEDFCDEAQVLAKKKAAQPPPPNPQLITAQASMLKAQSSSKQLDQKTAQDAQKAQADIQSAQIDAKSEEQQAQAEVARQQLENKGEQDNQQMEMMKSMLDIKLKEREAQIDAQMKEREYQMELKMKQMEMMFKQHEMTQKTAQSQQEHSLGLQQQQREHAMAAQHQEKQFAMDSEHQKQSHAIDLQRQQKQAAQPMAKPTQK